MARLPGKTELKPISILLPSPKAPELAGEPGEWGCVVGRSSSLCQPGPEQSPGLILLWGDVSGTSVRHHNPQPGTVLVFLKISRPSVRGERLLLRLSYCHQPNKETQDS